MIVKEIHSDEQLTPTDRLHATCHLHLNTRPPLEISSLEGPRPVSLHCHIDPVGDVCCFFADLLWGPYLVQGGRGLAGGVGSVDTSKTM